MQVIKGVFHCSLVLFCSLPHLQQYIGAVVLIVAVFLVLFSNHMEERLQEGKTVLRVDCHRTGPWTIATTKWTGLRASSRGKRERDRLEEKSLLLPHGQAIS